MKHSILRKIDISARQSTTNKTKMRKKMGCLYVADVYSEENLHAVGIERATPTVFIDERILQRSEFSVDFFLFRKFSA